MKSGSWACFSQTCCALLKHLGMAWQENVFSLYTGCSVGYIKIIWLVARMQQWNGSSGNDCCHSCFQQRRKMINKTLKKWNKKQQFFSPKHQELNPVDVKTVAVLI
ncbi:hypothetical protein ILYODFUR_037991 [Ilyodon furcidens]|uniref:Uncharacterized protein n=1 Tax=Ilyodon furcidens TaxID=33524 RepID=A0ABV0SUR9_9TELE